MTKTETPYYRMKGTGNTNDRQTIVTNIPMNKTTNWEHSKTINNLPKQHLNTPYPFQSKYRIPKPDNPPVNYLGRMGIPYREVENFGWSGIGQKLVGNTSTIKVPQNSKYHAKYQKVENQFLPA
jgi:hypothetical protein